MGLFKRKPNIEKLVDSGDVTGLLAIMADEDETNRISAAYALSTFADESYLEEFVKTLLTGDLSVDAPALTMKGKTEILRAFLPQLHHGGSGGHHNLQMRADGKINLDFTTMWGATKLLANTAGKEMAEKYFIELLDEYDFGWGIQGMAIVILSKIGAEAVEPLKAALTHDSANIRRGAAMALGLIDDPSAAEALKEHGL